MKVPAAKRWEEIVQLLETEGYVEAKDLAKRYQISMETVRKDLTFLAEMGIAKKEYGGAWLSFVNAEKNIEWRNNHYQEKRAIARFAVSMLKDQHMLILDAGSTCQCCASFINRISPMDIVTNSIGAFEQLSGKRHQVFLTGGKKREKNRSSSEIGRKHFSVRFTPMSAFWEPRELWQAAGRRLIPIRN